MPGVEARLAEQGGLLVAGDAADRDARRQRRCRSAVTPNRPLDGRTSGRHARRHAEQVAQLGRPGQRRRCRTACVRLAFDGSVAWTPPSGPPVRFHSSQESTVPKARSASGLDAALGRAATRAWWPRSRGRAPGRSCGARGRGGPPPRSSSQRRGGAPVLPHDGPVQRAAGAPVPHHRGLALVGDADRGDRARRRGGRPARRAWPGVAAQISSASCSTQPGAGKCWGNSR